MMKLRETFTCPLELTHDMLKGKWKPIILWRLRLGKTTLAQLERDIDGITQKMLLEHLKELAAFGFVDSRPAIFSPGPRGNGCWPPSPSCRRSASTT